MPLAGFDRGILGSVKYARYGLQPLSDLNNLEWLCVHQTHVEDIAPLNRFLVKATWLKWHQDSDISALASLTNLEELDISNIRVSDFSTLANLTNLKYLNLTG